MTYHDWIAAWRQEHPRAGGRCAHAAWRMAEAFPELRVVKGSVLIPGIGGLTYVEFDPEALKHHEDWPPALSSHWWCLAPDGTILDPTADQFTEVLEYRPELVHEVIQPKPGTSAPDRSGS